MDKRPFVTKEKVEKITKIYPTPFHLYDEKGIRENDKKFRVRTGHFMDELPQYKEISEKYFAEEKRLGEYRNKCKDDAIDLLKEHFYALWD